MSLITNDQQPEQLLKNDAVKETEEIKEHQVEPKEACIAELPKEKEDLERSKEKDNAKLVEVDVQKTPVNECVIEDKTTSSEQSAEKEHHEPAIQKPEGDDNAKDGALHETNTTESLEVTEHTNSDDHTMDYKEEKNCVNTDDPLMKTEVHPIIEHKINIVITSDEDEPEKTSADATEEQKDDPSTTTSTPVELSLAEEQSVQSADLSSSFEVVEVLPDNETTASEMKDTADSSVIVVAKDEKPTEPSESSQNDNDSHRSTENGTKTDAPETVPDRSTKPVGEEKPPATVVSLATEEDPKPISSETMSTPVIRTLPSPTPPPRRPSSAVLATGNLSKDGSRASFGSGKLFNSMPRQMPSPLLEEATRKKKKGMFSWLGGDNTKKKNKEVLETVSDGLRKIYKQKLYPLEEFYKFHDFHSPALDDPDFDAKPMILLVGQYSTGKTTFIRYLLEQDFPGIRIGPEPTTDRFIAVMHSEEEGVIPGNALVVDAKKQFRALSGFGNAFLNRFQCSTLPNQVLESITIVDTPGILSGEKQRIDRGYDFTGVLEWFAERVDRIILLFDAHKLDISDEFKRCIEALGGNEDKIRIVLNKSDMVDHQQLMRVYGALMWSLGKVFRTPEVSRVYLGSFWDKPLTHDINRRLFVDEQHDLFQDLQALPRNAALRKLNDLIKRARLAKVHAYIISELRKQMPSMIGKDKKKKELIQNLDKIFEQIQREHNISPGDFPDIQKMREKLQNQDFTKFNPLKPKLLEVVDGMLASDIARLMAQIPKEEQTANAENKEQPTVRGGAFAQASEAETPFGFGRYNATWGEGFDKGADEQGWVVSRERSVADSTFDSLNPVNGFISGRAAKEHMVKSKLPNAVLGKIWKLADVDQDGQLDGDEFALANYLINLKLEGHEIPSELPTHLIPPSKREKETVYPHLDEE